MIGRFCAPRAGVRGKEAKYFHPASHLSCKGNLISLDNGWQVHGLLRLRSAWIINLSSFQWTEGRMQRQLLSFRMACLIWQMPLSTGKPSPRYEDMRVSMCLVGLCLGEKQYFLVDWSLSWKRVTFGWVYEANAQDFLTEGTVILN